MRRLILNKSVKKEDIFRFTILRQQKEGGFSFVETTPPTLEDTYYAIGILKELRILYNDSKTLEFVESSIDDFKGPEHLFYISYIYNIFNHRPSRDFYSNMENVEVKSIDSCYNLFRAYENLNLKISNECLIDYLETKKSFKKSYLSITSKYIYLAKRIGISFNEKDYANWIIKSQNDDGGFGFKTGTTSFIENTYYGLCALHDLGYLPNDLGKCMNFVYSCYSNAGGFGRQKTTVPTLQNTYQALVSLRIVQNMKASITLF